MTAPRTGAPCGCRPGVQRDNCPTCEGTGWVIDFARIRSAACARLGHTYSATDDDGRCLRCGQRRAWITIGDVLIVEADRTSPYGHSLLGEERARLLRAFRDGEPMGDWVAWYGPAFGGARRLTDPQEVRWDGMAP